MLPYVIEKVKLQLPQIERYIFGTINVSEVQPILSKSHTDYWISIFWMPSPSTGLGGLRSEAFGFIKIKFEYPIGGNTYDAWIIFPELNGKSYVDEAGFEIITAKWIRDLRRGEPCMIHFDHLPSQERSESFGARFHFRYLPKPGARDTLAAFFG